MKVRKLFVLCLAAMILFSACGTDRDESPEEGVPSLQTGESQPAPPSEVRGTAEPASGNAQEPQTITNARFGFSLEIPASWMATDSAANGDGFFMEVPAADGVDIRVFGNLILYGREELVETLAKDTEVVMPFLFRDTSEGYVVYDEEAKSVRYINVKEACYVTLYVGYGGNPEWFAENKDMLDGIASTLAQYDGAQNNPKGEETPIR